MLVSVLGSQTIATQQQSARQDTRPLQKKQKQGYHGALFKVRTHAEVPTGVLLLHVRARTQASVRW